MSRTAWVLLIGIVLLVILAFGSTMLLPFWGRIFGLGFVRPGMFGFGFPFLLARGMPLFWLLLIAGIIVLVSVLMRGTQPVSVTGVPEGPLDILKRRYARGEITKEQFEEMKNTLGS